MKRPRKRLTLATLLAAPLLSIAMLGGTAMAGTTGIQAKTASTVVQAPQAKAPTSWSGCNNRICFKVEVVDKKALGGTIRAVATAWARFGSDKFDGHYQLLFPTGNYHNSGANKVWTHDPAYAYNSFLRPKGKWCVIGWQYNGGNDYTKIGEPCVNVTQ